MAPEEDTGEDVSLSAVLSSAPQGAAAIARVAWAGVAIGIAALAACWISKSDVYRQLESLQAEMVALQSRQAEQLAELSKATSSCFTGVRAPSIGAGWRLVRADGSEVALEGFAPVALGSAENRDWGSTRHTPAQFASVSVGSRLEPWRQNAGTIIAGNVPAVNAQAAGYHTAAASSSSMIDLGYRDLVCAASSSPEWDDVKASAKRELGSWSVGVNEKSHSDMVALLDSSMARLQTVPSLTTDCGLGRLCMSLLALLTGDVGGSIFSAPALHQPLLNVLLEVPWSLVVWSGWPIFAILAQLHLHTRGVDDLPQASGPYSQYFALLRDGLVKVKPEELAVHGAKYLELSESRQDAESSHAMPILCALASQLLGDDITVGGRPAVQEALRRVQGFYRQSVQSLDDLHASIISAWPLYSVIHSAAVRLAKTGSSAEDGHVLVGGARTYASLGRDGGGGLGR